MATVLIYSKCRALARSLFLRFCIFWGVPCKLPVTRANDDFLFLRACARARWKALFFQKLPIYVMMAPIWGVIILTNNKVVVLILWYYALPLFIVGTIGIIAGTLSATSGSFDIHVRREYARLQRAARAAESQVSVAVNVSATDVVQRMREQLQNQPWNVRKPRRQVGRPVHG